MQALRFSTLKTLVKQDLYYSLKSASGLLFLVFFGVFWMWVLWSLKDGSAQSLANPQAGAFMSWLFDSTVFQSLFTERSATFAAFYLIAINSIPVFVLFAASNQTANDIDTKYLRFLLPRCTRLEIYFARFIGAFVLIALSYLILSLIAIVIASFVDDIALTSMVDDGILICLTLILYSLPFVALMSLCAALVGSVGLSAMTGIGIYAIFSIMISVVRIKLADLAEVMTYLLPNSSKSLFMQLNWSSFMAGLGIALSYTLICVFLGWLVFTKRDV